MYEERRVVLMAAVAFTLKGCGSGMTVRERIERATSHRVGFAERTFAYSGGAQVETGTLIVSIDGERRDPKSSKMAWMVVILRGGHTIEFDDEGIDTKPLRRGDEVGFVRVVYEQQKDTSRRTRRSLLAPFSTRTNGLRRELVVTL